MRKRRGLPFWPTLMVAVALPLLIGFGVWQLQRAEWKAGLLAELERNQSAPLLDLGSGPIPVDAQFRTVRLSLACPDGQPLIRAGRSLSGQIGYSHIARCQAGSTPVLLDSRWAPKPDPTWFGGGAGQLASGSTEGVLVRNAGGEWLLVQSIGVPPAARSAPPSLDTISNNHFSYAVQWFGFAAILAIIYALYVRRWRLAAPDGTA